MGSRSIKIGGETDGFPFDLFDKSVRCEVGRPKEVIHVPEGVLRKAGSFFRTALKEDSKEGHIQTVELLDTSPKEFRRYAYWLVKGSICSKLGTMTEDLVDLYIPGEKLGDRTFQDYMIDTLVETSRETLEIPCLAAITRAYKNTPPGSPIRRLLVDWGSHYESTLYNGDEVGEEYFCREYLMELLRASLERKTLKDESKAELVRREVNPGCTYHLHREGEPCKSAEKKRSQSRPASVIED